MNRALSLAAALAALVALTGCGTEQGGGLAEQPSASGPSGDGATALTVVVQSGPGQGKRTFTLRCGPPGGDHPAAEAACSSLEAMEDPFAPVPPDTRCTEIYGGPQTATVTGTFRGEPVDARFDRTNGCAISRWDAHVELLVERGGADGT